MFDVQSFIREEREFLHDLASPLTVAMGMTESSLLSMDKDDPVKAREKLEKARQALAKISEHLTAHRNKLIKLSDDLKP